MAGHITTLAQLPIAFTIQKDPTAADQFSLQADDGSTKLSIIHNTGIPEQHSLALVSGTAQDPRPLATIKHDTSNTDAYIKIYDPDSGAPHMQFTMTYTWLENRRAVHKFSSSLSKDTDQLDFEWRSHGPDWLLVRCSETSSDQEVLAHGSLGTGEKEIPSFALKNTSHSRGDLWKVAAVVSWLRVWDKDRDLNKESGPNKAAIATALCVVL